MMPIVRAWLAGMLLGAAYWVGRDVEGYLWEQRMDLEVQTLAAQLDGIVDAHLAEDKRLRRQALVERLKGGKR